MLTPLKMPALNDKAQAWLTQSPKEHWVNNAPQSGATNAAAVINPSDTSELCQVAMGSATDVDAAVQAADQAFPAWSALPGSERAALMHKLADALETDTKMLAELESADVGKAIAAAEGFDIPFGIECIRYFAALADQHNPDTPLNIDGMDARVHRAPYGVCGFIFPWNFPFDLLMWGIAPALAAGNTVVVKPSEVTPLTTLYVAEVAARIGFPAGVINVVVGDGRSVGTPLAEHPKVKRMSFTGSPQVGSIIGEICGRRIVPCKLELGGKGAAVILEDADIDHAAEGLAGALTLNTGQVCCTATRYIVHESIADAFQDAMIKALTAVVVGPGLDPDTQMGPLVSQQQLDRVLGYLQKGADEGATLPLPGGKATTDEANRGYYVKPALLRGTPDNVCFREEIFGPVAFITTFKTDQEAIEQTNSLAYGLANSVWTTDLDRAAKVAEQLEAGNNWINAHNVFAYGLPYGGVNRSGMGGGVNSPDTFYDYLRATTIARPH